MNSYTTLSDEQKRAFLVDQYENHKKSFIEISKLCDTYPNKLRRDAIKFGIAIRTKSEAQKNALTSGVVAHPTKGQKRTEDVKQKIGRAVMESWESLTSEELENRRLNAKIAWQNKTEEEKQAMLREANAAVREAGKLGSKLELFLFKKLLTQGFEVEFHKEQSILNTKLQIDLFLPKLNIAIEVDGPSHFEPVWGQESLQRNKKYDNKKTGLIIGKGLYLIRVKQSRDFSTTRALLVFEQLIDIIDKISNKQLTDKTINIGD